jgi:hypothetical protein
MPCCGRKIRGFKMGGGRGSYFSSDAAEVKRKLQQSDESTDGSDYEARVNNLLTSKLTEFNSRDHRAINRHLAEIKKALEKELEGSIDLLFGGSTARHTAVNGLSDVDSLVILDSCELAEGTPNAAREYFARRLQEHFPHTEITQGTLAVTVNFADAEIQLLPAVSCEKHVKIADSSGHQWSEIRPKEFSNALTRTNKQAGRLVIPVVKLAKGIIYNLPEKHRISGYHAEALAVEIFKNYREELTPKAMLQHYFSQASELVRQPIKDRAGQSLHVDDSLGAPNSLERKIISDTLGRVSRRMGNADNTHSIEEWGRLYGE